MYAKRSSPPRGQPLVGRRREIGAALDVLDRTRLLTLTGVGGVGKTRLAHVVVERHAVQHGAERWCAEFDHLDPGGTPSAVVLTRPGAPGDGPMPLVAGAASTIATARAVLLLDGCDHVRGATAAVCAELLAACPDLRIVVTSRSPLGIPGEMVLRVGGLDVPCADAVPTTLLRTGSVRLFLARAREVAPDVACDLALVGRLCRALDGIPLALELAAARLRVLELEDLVAMVDDLAVLAGGRGSIARQRTARACLDWSHDALTPAAQVVLRRLSVFAGPFAADVALRVAGDGMPPAVALDALDELVDSSLVEPGSVGGRRRLHLLNTVRRYAADRLSASGERDAVRDQHLACVLSAVDRCRDDHAIAAVLAADDLDLRAALEHAIARRPEVAVGLAAELSRAWWGGGDIARGLVVARRALAGDPRLNEARATLLAEVAAMAAQAGELDAACRTADEAIELAGGDVFRGPATRALVTRGLVAPAGAEQARFLRRAEEIAVSRGAADGPRWDALLGRATAEVLAGRQAQARAALAAVGSAADLPAQWRAWHGLATAMLAFDAGYDAEAAIAARGAVACGDVGGPAVMVVVALALLSRLLVRHGDLAGGEAAAHEALRRARSSGAEIAAPSAQSALAYARLARGHPREAYDLAADATAAAHVPHAVMLGLDVTALAALELGDVHAADAAAGRLARTCAAEGGNPVFAAAAQTARGRVAILGGRHGEALDALHAAVALSAGRAAAREDALDALAAVLLLDGGDDLPATRLLGAVAASRGAAGRVRLLGGSGLEICARAALGDARFASAWNDGASRGLDAAAEYTQRGRGPRAGSADRWRSLTPTELRVTRLAMTGLSNPAIARELFMSRATVKTHLSHVYAKVGAANRTSLAAALGPDPDGRPV